MQKLTHSRMQCFKRCRKQHWFAYELGIRAKTDAKALRMGSAYQRAIELLDLGYSLEVVCQAIYEYYEGMDLPFEEETILQLVVHHHWYWGDIELEHLSPEHVFDLPLVNPTTGARSRTWRRAGAIDSIAIFEGQPVVKENKLKGCSVSPDSEVWDLLRYDNQITNYFVAAREEGYKVQDILYDITRKPTIRPTDVPLRDDEGIKIVLDGNGERVKTKNGKAWRQTASEVDGYVLQTRAMTRQEWGEKLAADIVARPDYYFARRVIVRTQEQIDEFLREVWDVGKTIREAQLQGTHYKTIDMDGCKFCAYQNPCFAGWSEGDPIPDDFEQLSDVHPELNLTKAK